MPLELLKVASKGIIHIQRVIGRSRIVKSFQSISDMSDKIARAGTAGICNHMTLSPQLEIMHTFTGYCMVLQAFACYAGHVCMLAVVSTVPSRPENGVHMYH